MPKGKLSEVQIRQKYGHMISRWEAGDFDTDAGRPGSLPQELIKIREELRSKHTASAAKRARRWFAPKKSPLMSRLCPQRRKRRLRRMQRVHSLSRGPTESSFVKRVPLYQKTPKTLEELYELLGKHARGDSEVAALLIFEPSHSSSYSSNQSQRESRPQRKSNMSCKYCNIPLSAREFNKHIDDGTRYGRCPMAPQPDLILEAVKAAARERAKRVIVGNVRGKGRKCSICGLPITADLREMGSDIYMVSHERFYDKDKHSVWYCPVGENIGTGELEELRTLKENRRQEQQRKKNEYKRKRYREEQENA